MSVKIVISPFLMHLINGARRVDVTGNTVGECLNELMKRFPGTEKLLLDENGKLLGYIDVYINGQSSYPEELTKAVHEGDELYIMNVIVGG